jgi:hypothetical protein|tara:strand:+ start:10083 stop:10511 length:429 start_codon:yes stop_codon:yes gene_type:complete
MYKEDLPYLLIFLGSIPFIFLSFLKLFNYQEFFQIEINFILSIYSLSIISFICGSHWGIFLSNSNLGINLFLLSNFLTILSFIGFLLLEERNYFFLQILILIILLLIDVYIFRKKITQKKYVNTRILVTSLVSSFLVIPIII